MKDEQNWTLSTDDYGYLRFKETGISTRKFHMNVTLKKYSSYEVYEYSINSRFLIQLN
jgi:hypothetical protein